MRGALNTPEAFAVLGRWYRTPLGRRVAEAEAACLARLLEDSFGYYLLQLGPAEPFATALAVSRIRQRVLLAPVLPFAGPPPPRTVRLLGQPECLPFAADSLDAAVIPHLLEFVAEPRAILCEVARTLIPEGRLFVLGFNPLSAWGAARLWPRRRDVLWHGAALTPTRLRDDLKTLGLQVEIREMLMFRPPFRGAFGARFDWLDTLGQRYWPALGGIYLLRAVKRVAAPLAPRLAQKARRAPLPSGRALKPTARAGGLRG